MDPLPRRLTTSRLVLRPWEPDDAAALRELWAERDPRVPPGRRLVGGRPTVGELRERLVTGLAEAERTGIRTYAVEPAQGGALLGWCGLVVGRGSAEEPELAYELFRDGRGRGYATEAAVAVVAEADSCGFTRLWATVWDWNEASLRVLARVGFEDSGRRDEAVAGRGTTVWWVREVRPAPPTRAAAQRPA